jgi:hypothetical protein
MWFWRPQPSTPADPLVLLGIHPAPFGQLSKLSPELSSGDTSIRGLSVNSPTCSRVPASRGPMRGSPWLPHVLNVRLDTASDPGEYPCRSPERDTDCCLPAGQNRRHSPTILFGAQHLQGRLHPLPLHLACFRAYASTCPLPSTPQGSILGSRLTITQAGFTPARSRGLARPHCPRNSKRPKPRAGTTYRVAVEPSARFGVAFYPLVRRIFHFDRSGIEPGHFSLSLAPFPSSFPHQSRRAFLGRRDAMVSFPLHTGNTWISTSKPTAETCFRMLIDISLLLETSRNSLRSRVRCPSGRESISLSC